MKRMTTTRNLKELNTDLVREILRKQKSTTKNQLASESGLSVATCGNILRDLVETGEVIESTLAPSTGGRPAKVYDYNGNYAHILMIYGDKEYGKSAIHYQVSDLLGQALEEGNLTMEIITLDHILEVIDDVFQRFPGIASLGFGIPGVVSDGYISYCDLPSFKNTHLQKILEEKYKVKVIVENDVNASAIGFHSSQDFSNTQSLVYAYYPTDDYLGSGIIINGKLHRGMSNYAGELGFLPFDDIKTSLTSQHNQTEKFELSVAKTLMTYICVINPSIIILSGQAFNDQVIKNIQENLSGLCSSKHLPVIYHEKEMKFSYYKGLFILSLHQLFCNLTVTTKYL